MLSAAVSVHRCGTPDITARDGLIARLLLKYFAPCSNPFMIGGFTRCSVREASNHEWVAAGSKYFKC